MKDTTISERKTEHLQINLNKNVSSALETGLRNYRFIHNAMPELNLLAINPTTTFLSKAIDFPLLISSMTGGSEQTSKVNYHLAEAAQEFNLPMGVGSQRVAIDDPSFINSFQVRKYAPSIPLLANLGAIQLNYGYEVKDFCKAVEMIDADGLILHLNPLQEALQTAGNTDFTGLFVKIEQIVRNVNVPVIVKEVGWGINAVVAKRFMDMGVYAVDVAGAGGTSWSQVEMYRQTDPLLIELAASFSDWGIPTAEAIVSISSAIPDARIIASGGISSGVDIAKCIALGADLVGMAGSILKEASVSSQAVVERIKMIKRQFMITMFSAGIPDVPSLKKTKLIQKISS